MKTRGPLLFSKSTAPHSKKKKKMLLARDNFHPLQDLLTVNGAEIANLLQARL